MRKIVDNIKNTTNADYRVHVTGIVCDIFDAFQVTGMSSVLSVAPVGFNDPQNLVSNPKRYNVLPVGSPGVYGFPTALKESFYAYVLTDDISLLEGKPAVIIPKSALLSNPGSDWSTENNMISADNLNNMIVRKEDLIVSRKYS